MNKMAAAIMAVLVTFLYMSAPARATPAEVFKGFFAVSTRELEELKKDAAVKNEPITAAA